MTLLAGATGIGYAAGSAAAGRLADVNGHTGAFAVTVAAAASAAVLAAVSQPLLRRLGGPDLPGGALPGHCLKRGVRSTSRAQEVLAESGPSTALTRRSAPRLREIVGRGGGGAVVAARTLR